MTTNLAQFTLKLGTSQQRTRGEVIKYTAAISSMKVLLHWGRDLVELELFDVDPLTLWFRGNANKAILRDAPMLSISLKVGQKWREWEEIPCEWNRTTEAESIGLSPQWGEGDEKEFKKYLELTLSI